LSTNTGLGEKCVQMVLLKHAEFTQTFGKSQEENNSVLLIVGCGFSYHNFFPSTPKHSLNPELVLIEKMHA
jgi:hypothetical protein